MVFENIFMLTINDVLAQWESIGIFDTLLPLILVFAVVFGILTTTKILGDNRGISLVVAFVIALLALRLGIVSVFFAEIFPRVGVGLAVILTLLILVGLFIPHDEKRFWYWGFGAIGFVIFVIIAIRSFDQFGWLSTGAYGVWDDFGGWIIGAVLFIGFIIAIAASSGSRNTNRTAPFGVAQLVPHWGSGNGP